MLKAESTITNMNDSELIKKYYPGITELLIRVRELQIYFAERAVLTQNVDSNSLSDFIGWLQTLNTRIDESKK